MSEVEAIRHFTRLSTQNYAIDLGLYPLGSCTMKYNPRVNEQVARIEGLAWAHPYQPESLSQGVLEVMGTLEKMLAEITGMDAVTLQPAAGAHGEFTGILMVRALLESQGNPRKKLLIPDSAHGTNPATATMAGYEVENIKSNERGMVDVESLARAVDEDVAALMITNPNTLGVFEENITRIARNPARQRRAGLHGRREHERAGGRRAARRFRHRCHASQSAQDIFHSAWRRRSRFGTRSHEEAPDSVSTQAAPGAREQPLDLELRSVRNPSAGCAPSTAISACTFARSPTSWRTAAGLRNATLDAVLNANYIRALIQPYYDLPHKAPTMHECVFSDERQTKQGVHTGDIAKRLIDYGFHPYTVSFPLIVHGAMMIEPTETESKAELDLFVDAMISIAAEIEQNPELVLKAPHHTRTSRVDEVTAARKPIVRWKP